MIDLEKYQKLNLYLCSQEQHLDALFYLEGVQVYKDKKVKKDDWDGLLDTYVNSKWWVFVKQN